MFGVKAGHLAPEHRLEKRPTEGIDLVQHRFATRANCKTSQRAGPGGRFEDGFAGADGGCAYYQCRKGQRRLELLQANLLLGAPGLRQEP